MLTSLIPVSLALALLQAALRFKDDGDLARRLQVRDGGAMRELYDRYGRLVYSLIMRMVRNSAAAEDLVQETFLRVWNRMQGFDQERGALGPWVLTVARNRAIDYLRSADGRMSASALDPQPAGAGLQLPEPTRNTAGEFRPGPACAAPG